MSTKHHPRIGRLRRGTAVLITTLAAPAGLAAAEPAGAAPAHASTGSSTGSVSSARVLLVERNLRNLGWLRSRAVDGVVRAEDRRAIKNFQSSRCLVVDGIAGPVTRSALLARVRAIQAEVGVARDGYYGPVTRRAVRQYQRTHGLAVDGIAGPLTMDRMGVERYSRQCR